MRFKLLNLSTYTFIFFSVYSSSLSAQISAEKVSAEKVRTCGVITPQSGPTAHIGISVMNGIILSDLLFDRKNRVQYLFEDDQFIPKQTVNSAHKLIKINKINCLIVFGSTTSLAASSIAERAKIEMFGIGISPKIGEKQNFTTRFHISISQEGSLLRKGIRDRGYKKISIITSEHDATTSLRSELLKNKEFEVINDEQVVLGESDLRIIAQRIATAKPDGVFINLIPPQVSIFARQLRTLGFKGDYFSGPPVFDIQTIRDGGFAFENLWGVNIDDSKAGDFFKKYIENFNYPPAPEAIYGYELANLIASIDSNSSIQEFLRANKKFSGLLGDYNISPNNIDVPGALREIHNGKVVSFEYRKLPNDS